MRKVHSGPHPARLVRSAPGQAPGPSAGPLAAMACSVLLLGTLAATLGLGPAGWLVGLGWGVGISAALTRWSARYGVARLGPADRVTLLRAALCAGVAALVADAVAGLVLGEPPAGGPLAPVLVALTVVALVGDAVDGWVARRTGTSSPLGARFDMEVDAFLLLVLSAYVASSAGVWVLAIGLARYLFGAAGLVWPDLRRALPPRYWRKVVAAVQGIVLVVAASGVLPVVVTTVALLAALALLGESFGRDVLWLWRTRRGRAGRSAEALAPNRRT